MQAQIFYEGPKHSKKRPFSVANIKTKNSDVRLGTRLDILIYAYITVKIFTL